MQRSRLARALLGLSAAFLLTSLHPAGGTASTVPPVNGRIAFASPTGIGSVNPDGSGPWGVRLSGGDVDPAWSPDGQRLAVVSRWPGSEGIWLVDPDGSEPAAVTSSVTDAEPAWSPDGSRLAFASGGDLFVIRPDGSGRTRLTDLPSYDSSPSWSPDGRRLVFARGVDGPTDLYILEVESGAESRITSTPQGEWEPAWSPDGAEIAFVSDAGGFVQIYARAPDGSGLRRVTDGPLYVSSPAWSPDGRQLTLAGDGSIWVVARDGTGLRRLPISGGVGLPTWQPVVQGPFGCTHNGTAGNDVLVGSEGNDVLCGFGGDDTLIGLGGGDWLRGGEGRDVLAGATGNDFLLGDEGDDRLDARDGHGDIALGGPGVDLALIDELDGAPRIERARRDRNLAIWRPISASGYSATNPPVRAVDGRADDWWNSGGWPPQWIEIDLERAVDIGRLRVVAGEQPNGVSFLVLGKGPGTGGAYRLLQKFRGPTAAFQELVRVPKKPWRRIRWLRIATQTSGAAGWVSWHEIEAYPPPARKG